MTNIRRYWEAGFPYFLTHDTHGRKDLLLMNIDLWWNSVHFVKEKADFEMIAWVVLPDHVHLLIDPKDSHLSDLMKRLKLKFSGLYRSRNRLNSGRIWQHRFWDHKIRDEQDYSKHLDYIHYNPVKHGMVLRPIEYEHSSFRAYYDQGYYPDDWGVKETFGFRGEYGE